MVDYKDLVRIQDQAPAEDSKKGIGSSQSPNLISVEDYEKLRPWILSWHKTISAISEIASSDEGYSQDLLRTLSYHLALREIMHSNVFLPQRQTIESLRDMLILNSMIGEAQILSTLLSRSRSLETKSAG